MRSPGLGNSLSLIPGQLPPQVLLTAGFMPSHSPPSAPPPPHTYTRCDSLPLLKGKKPWRTPRALLPVPVLHQHPSALLPSSPQAPCSHLELVLPPSGPVPPHLKDVIPQSAQLLCAPDLHHSIPHSPPPTPLGAQTDPALIPALPE